MAGRTPGLAASADLLLSSGGNSRPDSNAVTIETDRVPFGKGDARMRPWVNLTSDLQSTADAEFDGAGSNRDGSGNNTRLGAAWLMV